jgi:hypothetical protein
MTTPVTNNGDNNNFDEILDRCLRAVEAGQATIEQCAARYPNFPELANLLRMAAAFSDLPRPQMPAAARLERRLQTQFRERVRVSTPRRPALFPLRRLLLTVGAMLLILFGAGTGLVVVSANALPGDGLNYSLKRNIETIRLRFGNETLYEIAETRLNEVRGLAARGRAVGEEAINDMYNSVSAALIEVNDATKRINLTTDAENAVLDALSKGMVNPQLAQNTIQKLQNTLNVFVPNLPTSTDTPTPSVAAQPTTGTPSTVPSATPTATQAASVTLTPSFTASSTETPAPPTVKPSATSTPTLTPTRTVPAPVLGPSYTATLGRGPAVTVQGIPTKTSTAKATQESTAQETVAVTDTPTVEGTEPPTQPATEEASATIEVTETPTATEPPTLTPTATSTNTPLPTATPIPPTATFTATPLPPTPNGLPPQNLKQNPQEITFHECKPEGNGGDPILNLNRNRVDDAKQYPQTGFDNIAKLPWPKDAEGKPHDQWSQDTRNAIAQVEGLPVMVEVYLVKVQENGPEEQSCNSNDHTWQLWLLPNPGSANDLGKALVAGVTPRVVSKHAGWTLDKLNALAAAGAKVRVSGWLLFNEEQAGEVGKSRVSLWEIHPVMQIAVNKGNQWVNLDDYQP